MDSAEQTPLEAKKEAAVTHALPLIAPSEDQIIRAVFSALPTTAQQTSPSERVAAAAPSRVSSAASSSRRLEKSSPPLQASRSPLPDEAPPLKRRAALKDEDLRKETASAGGAEAKRAKVRGGADSTSSSESGASSGSESSESSSSSSSEDAESKTQEVGKEPVSDHRRGSSEECVRGGSRSVVFVVSA